MNKEVIIIGDIEMGGGTLTDDFISDQTLSRLIYSLCNKNVPVDLVLNGDTFDFLKCPYIENQVASYPRHITAEISLAKLRLIYNAHTPVFEALKRFVAEKSGCRCSTSGSTGMYQKASQQFRECILFLLLQ